MRKPLLVGNWKMNLALDEAKALAQASSELAAQFSDRVDVGIAPATPFLGALAGLNPALRVYGQNIAAYKSGAYTGEAAAGMLRDLGCYGALVGHSERRAIFRESDQDTAMKTALARRAGLGVILCVGETLEQREAGNAFEVVEEQLLAGLSELDNHQELVIAYEPVWAIGTGKTASADDAQAVHTHLRAVLAQRFGDEAAPEIRIQYGGSANPSNAADLLAQPDIDGLLIGGASLKADSFKAMIEAAAS